MMLRPMVESRPECTTVPRANKDEESLRSLTWPLPEGEEPTCERAPQLVRIKVPPPSAWLKVGSDLMPPRSMPAGNEKQETGEGRRKTGKWGWPAH